MRSAEGVEAAFIAAPVDDGFSTTSASGATCANTR